MIVPFDFVEEELFLEGARDAEGCSAAVGLDVGDVALDDGLNCRLRGVERVCESTFAHLTRIKKKTKRKRKL